MEDKYLYMNDWNEQEVLEFKEKGTENLFNNESNEFKTFGPTSNGLALSSILLQPELIETQKSTESNNKTLVSEGDSWFDYKPGTDLIDCLRNHHGYKIVNYGNAGDTLENMIYGTGINSKFLRTSSSIHRVLRKIGKTKPKVFLFSGGGNDIAGDKFTSYLNHLDSGLSVLRLNYIDNMINVVFKTYFNDLIQKIQSISPDTNIVAHGYGYTSPTGEGVKVFFIKFAGPWLRPALAMKGIFDPIKQKDCVDHMINSYNNMLAGLDRDNARFHHIDLRDILDPYTDWDNELHLKNSAYARAADVIHQKIMNI